MIHWPDIILAILVAFLVREWFILGFTGEATEREPSEMVGAPTSERPTAPTRGAETVAPSRSAASPVRTLGAASTSQQNGLTADAAGRADNPECGRDWNGDEAA